ncbi:unnamed protein product [Soboliphyme baturini]|uniref:DUF5917 domain-containing protein n=1 Tax=Soboliphyme baturini TaxID=241478 RepID=A0A183IZY8_9BILA|nr:unnamed protein product [Soboliphyme baturini]
MKSVSVFQQRRILFQLGKPADVSANWPRRVLASGLAGLYSALPRRYASSVIPDDWSSLTLTDVNAILNLRTFCCIVEFCNAVIQVAHELINHQLISFIYDGFFTSILKAALQDSSEEDVFAVTAYFELVCRLSKEPLLRDSIVKLLLSDVDGDDQRIILDLLVDRIKTTNSSLFRISLSLMETLIEFCSEPLMFELVFKYLISQNPLLCYVPSYSDVTKAYIDAAEKYSVLSSACSIQCETARTGSSDCHARQATSDDPSLQYSFVDYLCYEDARMGRIAAACSSWRCPCSTGFSEHCRFCVNSEAEVSQHGSGDSKKNCISVRNRFAAWEPHIVQLGVELRNSVSQIWLSYLKLTFVENSVLKETHLPVEEEMMGAGDVALEHLSDANSIDEEDPRTLIDRMHESLVSRYNHHCSSDDARTVGCSSPDFSSSNANTPYNRRLQFSETSVPSDFGPFLSVLLDRLTSMVDNSPFENMLITSVICLVACFPYPMMRLLLPFDAEGNTSRLMQVTEMYSVDSWIAFACNH